MSDQRPSSGDAFASDELLPSWAASILREPGESRPAARAAIMDAVRAAPGARRGRFGFSRSVAPSLRTSRWPRRGLLTPFGAMAAMLAAVVSIQSMRGIGLHRTATSLPALQTAALMLGDTVVRSADGGSVMGDAVRDTMRIVEFVLRGPGVRTASVVGDFNAWRAGETVLTRASDGAWRARVLVPRDMVRFAYDVERVERAVDAVGDAQPGAVSRAARTLIDSI